MNLTPKQQRFCAEYIRTGNASEAYRIAYNAKNMKPETVNRKAKELLDNGKIAARIDELAKDMTAESLVDAETVLRRLIEIDQMDICDILNDDWTLKPLTVWPKIWRSYITAVDVQEIKVGESDPDVAVAFLKKIKWPDKLKNLEMLGKHRAIQAFTPEKDKGVIPEFPEVIEIYAYQPGRESEG